VYYTGVMTTAHRPTFDQARAKSGGQQTSIQHKRALPGYKTLKYRKKAKTVNDDFDSDEDDDNDAEGIDGKRLGYITKKDVQSLRETLLLEEQKARGESDLTNVVAEPQAIEKKKLNDQDVEQGSNDDVESYDERDSSDTDESSSDSDESNSSDEEEEELLKELQNIRKQKEETKVKETDKFVEESIPTISKKEAEPIMKSWRSQSLFHRQKRHSDEKEHNPLINSMMHSDFHRRFMDSYFK